MFFLPQSKGNSRCLMVPALEGQKEAVPSSNYWNHHRINENILVSSFVLFDCKSTEIYILELVH
jgi:hypothetical protein